METPATLLCNAAEIPLLGLRCAGRPGALQNASAQRSGMFPLIERLLNVY